MKYLNQSDGAELTQGQVRQLHKNKSLPRVFTQDVCDLLGITPVLETPKPQPSTRLKSVVRNGTTIDGLGNTIQAWTEVDAFQDDENGTKAENEAAHLASELQKLKDQKCSEVDTKTKEDIIAIANPNKQMLYMAKSIQYNRRNNPADVAERDALEAIFVQIETLVNDGNTLEASIQAMTTFEEVEAV